MGIKKYEVKAVAEFDFVVYAETPKDAEKICLDNLNNGLFVAEIGKEYDATYNDTYVFGPPLEMEMTENEYAAFREHRGNGDETVVVQLRRGMDELRKIFSTYATRYRT